MSMPASARDSSAKQLLCPLVPLTTLRSSVELDRMTPRSVLLIVAILFAVGEALDSIDVGLIGVIFALLFATGALLMRKGRRSGVILVGTLVVVEVIAWPTFKRQTTVDWVVQLPFLIVGLVGLVAFAMVLRSDWRTPKAAGPA